MTKSELIEKISLSYPHLYHKDIADVVETIFYEISHALMSNRRVELRGFGSFFIKKRNARIARNPRTGGSVMVQERWNVFFRTGQNLKKNLNSA